MEKKRKKAKKEGNGESINLGDLYMVPLGFLRFLYKNMPVGHEKELIGQAIMERNPHDVDFKASYLTYDAKDKAELIETFTKLLDEEAPYFKTVLEEVKGGFYVPEDDGEEDPLYPYLSLKKRLAVVHLHEDNDSLARKLFEEVMEVYPEDPLRARDYLAFIYAHEGQVGKLEELRRKFGQELGIDLAHECYLLFYENKSFKDTYLRYLDENVYLSLFLAMAIALEDDDFDYFDDIEDPLPGTIEDAYRLLDILTLAFKDDFPRLSGGLSEEERARLFDEGNGDPAWQIMNALFFAYGVYLARKEEPLSKRRLHNLLNGRSKPKDEESPIMDVLELLLAQEDPDEALDGVLELAEDISAIDDIGHGRYMPNYAAKVLGLNFYQHVSTLSGGSPEDDKPDA